MSKTASLVKTIRLDDNAIEEILDSLDQAIPEGALDRRRAPRYRYSVKSCVVHLHSQAGGPPTSYLVSTRDISRTGMGFLHGAFIYPGAKMVVQLITLHGTWQNVPAVVARCDYVTSGIHDVGVRFLEAIDASEFCAEAAPCRVLIAEDNPSIVAFTKVLLAVLNADVDSASNGEEAVKLALANVYDVIMMDMDMPKVDGYEAVRQLRAKGYSGKIVAITGMTQPDDEQKCLNAGCDSYLPKPVKQEQLRDLLRSLRQEPLISSLAQDRSMLPHIDQFVSQLPKRVRELEAAFVAGDCERLQAECRDLKGESGSFGFEPIQVAAADVEKALIADPSISAIQSLFPVLVRLCCQARPSPQPTPVESAESVEDVEGELTDADGAEAGDAATVAPDDEGLPLIQPTPGANANAGGNGTADTPHASCNSAIAASRTAGPHGGEARPSA